MSQASAFSYSIVLVDVAGFTDPARTLAHQTMVRAGLYMALKEAFAEARIDWAACYNEDRGDGVMILVPADVPATVLADQMLERLVAALREFNAMLVPAAAIRLRIALHSGQVRHDSAGAVGPALNFAFRLLAAPVVKRALRDSTGILAVIASEEFYQDVISQTPAATAPEAYTEIDVAFDAFSSTAWLRLAGEAVGRVVPAASAGLDLPTVAHGGWVDTIVRTGTFAVSVYLADGASHEAVEAAVARAMELAGVPIVEREAPVVGSWFRRMRADPAVREIAMTAAHAAETRLVREPDAQVTAMLMQHIGPIITALHPEKEAVVRLGAVLIVKLNEQLMVHQLSAVQQFELDHQPQLVAPRDILAALGLPLVTNGHQQVPSADVAVDPVRHLLQRPTNNDQP